MRASLTEEHKRAIESLEAVFGADYVHHDAETRDRLVSMLAERVGGDEARRIKGGASVTDIFDELFGAKR